MYKLLIYFLILYTQLHALSSSPITSSVFFFILLSPFTHFLCAVVVILPLLFFLLCIFETLWTKCAHISLLTLFVISCVSCKCSIVLSSFFSSAYHFLYGIEWQIKQHDEKDEWIYVFEPDLQLIFYVKYETKAWGDGMCVSGSGSVFAFVSVDDTTYTCMAQMNTKCMHSKVIHTYVRTNTHMLKS